MRRLSPFSSLVIQNIAGCNILYMTLVNEDSRDQAQLAAFHAGDHRAGRALYQRHFARIRRYFANKACQPADTEDLVHRTFEMLFRRSTKIGGADRFTAYLIGIAHNVWLGHLRERMRHRWTDLPGVGETEALERFLEGHGVSLRAVGAGESTILERDEHLRKLLNELRELPLAQQEAIELHYWEDMTFEEVGAVLGIPVGTAKSRLRLVKLRLHERMVGMRAPAADADDQVLAQVDKWARQIATNVRRMIPN